MSEQNMESKRIQCKNMVPLCNYIAKLKRWSERSECDLGTIYKLIVISKTDKLECDTWETDDRCKSYFRSISRYEGELVVEERKQQDIKDIKESTIQTGKEVFGMNAKAWAIRLRKLATSVFDWRHLRKQYKLVGRQQTCNPRESLEKEKKNS